MKETDLIKQLLDLRSNKNDDDYLIKAESLWKKWMGGNDEKKLNEYYSITVTECLIDKDFGNLLSEYDMNMEIPNKEASIFFGKDFYPDCIEQMCICMINVRSYTSEDVEWFKNEYFEQGNVNNLHLINIPISTQNRYSKNIQDYYFLDKTHEKFAEFSVYDEIYGEAILDPDEDFLTKEEVLIVDESDFPVTLLTFDQLTYLLAQIKIKSYTENLKIAMENKVKVGLPNAMNKEWYYINL